MALDVVDLFLAFFALAMVSIGMFVVRTSFLATPTVSEGNPELRSALASEVERARRLQYPLTVACLSLRPGSSTGVVDAAIREIDTVVVGENVLYLLLPGADRSSSLLERITTASDSIASWSAAVFPEDALTIGELLEIVNHAEAGHQLQPSLPSPDTSTAE